MVAYWPGCILSRGTRCETGASQKERGPKNGVCMRLKRWDTLTCTDYGGSHGTC